MFYLEKKECEICETKKSAPVYSYKSEHYPHNIYETASWDGRQKINLSIVKCVNCGLTYTKPSFKEDFLHLVYPAETNKKNDFDYFANNTKYLNFINVIRKHLKNNTACDFGTKYGVFPYLLMQETNLTAFGIELNEAAVKIGSENNVDIHQGTICDLPQIIKKKGLTNIDNFFMDDVLEHLVHPKRDLKILNSLQPIGGKLFLRQMNLNSLGHKIYRKNWYYFQPAAHMYYFNKKTIEKLLSLCGYEIELIIQPKFFHNLLKTIIIIIKRIIKKIFVNKNNWVVNNKIMYLQNRGKSADDMFLVIAYKKTNI